MPQYVLELSHTDRECLHTLDTIVAYGLHIMNYTWFGCMAGVHTGWINIEASSEAEARQTLPPSIRPLAHVVEVQKFTPEQVKGFHKK